MRLTSQTFIASSSWICPAGVTQVIALGQGGGAAGTAGSLISGGRGGPGGTGGMSTFLVPVLLTVVPGTTYVITIGAGGDNSIVSTGGDTSFGALQTWSGAVVNAGSTRVGYSTAYTDAVPAVIPPYIVWNFPMAIPGGTNATQGKALGNAIVLGSYAASGVATSFTSQSGSGGGAGNSSDAGIGGTGGDGGGPSPAVDATAGGNAPSTSYGAGGGGGGGARGIIGHPAGAGGNGAGGRLIILWAE